VKYLIYVENQFLFPILIVFMTEHILQLLCQKQKYLEIKSTLINCTLNKLTFC